MSIKQPTLVINKQISLRNIQKIVQKAERNGITIRPHFKTHQSIEIGNWFKEMGVHAITVSSVKMAKCFADYNWTDITIAFPVNILEIDDIIILNKKLDLKLLVDSIETVHFLKNKVENEFKIWIAVDVGYHREGLSWEDKDGILKLATEIGRSRNLELIGILTHAGHSCKSRSQKEIMEIHKESIASMVHVKKYLISEGFSNIKISVGDTPTISIAEDFPEIDEIRPGNFVVYDLKQVQKGACKFEDVAIRIACPVVAKYSKRQEILIMGGAIHFSKDYVIDDNGKQIFGLLCAQTIDFWWKPIPSSYLSSISQEHGIIKVEEMLFDKINIGDIVYIVPAHACLAFNCMDSFQLPTGETFPILCK